ncbi:MAG TPA: cupin domain-containing protein [Thermoleophilaceae bacterium]|jgi:mannose-6-phosphate isomerase-like protein (cupin superfamily)
MAATYTLARLTEVEDQAPGFGISEFQEARFANDALATESTGVSFHRVKPGMRQAFAHRHESAEEVYVVVSGAGRVKIDDEILELEALDALRIAPTAVRQFEAGPDGLEMIVFGPRLKGDGEVMPGWWSD